MKKCSYLDVEGFPQVEGHAFLVESLSGPIRKDL